MPAPQRKPTLRAIARSQREERSREETRERIAAAALQLFLDEGFERVSMRRIAEAVGYTPGALYSYFQDKDEILYALHLEGFAILRESLRDFDRIARTPLARYRRLGELYLRFAFEHPQYYQLMFIMRGPAKRIQAEKRWQEGLDNYDRVRAVVRECMEAGLLPQGDVEAAAFANWAMVHGIASLVIRGRTAAIIPDGELPRAVAEAYDFAVRTLLRQRPERGPERPGRAAARRRRR